MGIHCNISDDLTVDLIDRQINELSATIKLFVDITHDAGANISVQITHVDETKVVVYHTYYHGTIPPSNPERLMEGSNYGFIYRFEKDPDDHSNNFEKFLFVVSCIVKAVPWICTEQVLRRVVADDKLAYQPA